MTIDLELSDERQQVGRSAREFFSKRCPPEVVRQLEATDAGWSREMWAEMAGLGWLGITLPTSHGGGGGSFADLYPLYEEMGRFLVPSPHLETVALAAEIILAAGTDAQRAEYLPAIAAGSCVISTAVVEPAGTYDAGGIALEARQEGDALVIDGVKLLVPFASSADLLLTAVRTAPGGDDGITLVLVDTSDPGVTVAPMTNMAGVALFEVTFQDVRVPFGATVGAVGGGWEPYEAAATTAAVLQSVTIVGAARAVLEMTNQYAKDREQFGSPIGRYQAVQYLVSDILIDLHRLELLAKQAVFRIDSGRPHRREAAAATAFGKEAAAHLHRQAHEVHAGVAFMHEHDLSLYSRRSKYWENNLGDAAHHHERVAAAMGV